MSTERAQSPVGYAFGPFVIDTVRRTVWRAGSPVPVYGKSFEVLLVLLANRDRIVTKDELLQRVWPDTFVQENNLAKHVSTLRKVLDQKPDGRDFILTVQGRGYRFVAPVTELSEIPAHLAARTVEVPPGDRHDEMPAEAADVDAGEPLAVAARARWRAWAVVGGAVAVCTVIAAAWYVVPRRRPEPHAAAPGVLHQITYGPSAQITPAWAPDGRTLAYASDRDGNFDIYVQRTDGTDPVRLTSGPGQDWQPAWSPDGRWIAYRSDENGGGIFVVGAGGGPPRRLAPFGFDPRWSADGQHLLVRSSLVDRPRARAFVLALDGTPPRQVRADLTQQFVAAQFAWHPDGRRISIVGRRDGQWTFATASLDDDGDVVTSRIPRATRDLIRDLDLTIGRFVWAASGRQVYFEGRSHEAANIWMVQVDPETLAWDETLERFTTGPGPDRNLSVSADGHRIAFETAAERTRVWAFTVSPDTGTVMADGRAVTAGAAGEFDAAVSQDGGRLVYRTVRDGRQELWQISLADGRTQRLIADASSVRSVPRWSPDGANLTYLISARSETNGSTPPALAVMPTGGGPERIVHASATSELVPDDWSADGRAILGACRLEGTTRSAVCLIPADGGAPPTVIASDPERSLRNARFSPDQQWITFTASSTGAAGSTVFVRRTSGGPLIAMTEGTAFEDKAHWSPDGRIVYSIG